MVELEPDAIKIHRFVALASRRAPRLITYEGHGAVLPDIRVRPLHRFPNRAPRRGRTVLVPSRRCRHSTPRLARTPGAAPEPVRADAHQTAVGEGRRTTTGGLFRLRGPSRPLRSRAPGRSSRLVFIQARWNGPLDGWEEPTSATGFPPSSRNAGETSRMVAGGTTASILPDSAMSLRKAVSFPGR